MIGSTPTDEVTETVTAIETKRLLLGYLPLQEAISTLQSSHQLANPELLEEDSAAADSEESEAGNGESVATSDGGFLEQKFQEQWMAAQQSVDPLDGVILEHPPVEPLPEDDELQNHVEEFTETDTFTALLADIDDSKWEIGRIPIDHLVAFQKSVNTEAYQDIPTWDNDPLAVLQYTLPTEANQVQMRSPVQSQGLVGMQFTSRNPNIQVASMEVTDPEDAPGSVVSFHIRPKANFVQVARLNGRCILKNGYHRVYQLMCAGETHVPCVIRDVDDYSETGGQNPGHLPDSTVLGDRPPLLTDFETEVAVDVKRPATNKVIRATAETTDIPR